MRSGSEGVPPAATEPVFLTSLDDGQSAALHRRGMNREFARGSALFHERGAPDRVYVVRRGFVKLSRLSEDGREVILAIRGPGDLLGELSAIDGSPRSATAVALDPVSALVLPASDFLSFLEEEPRVGMVVLRTLSHRLREADIGRVELSVQDTVARVAARIGELAERFGNETDGGVEIDLPMSQEELAGWTGCSRDSVVKALQTMRSLGWIETARRRITVLEPGKLRGRTGG
jgi:CRP/FNR family transcriptional regulator, cyclic AMP receptor protein